MAGQRPTEARLVVASGGHAQGWPVMQRRRRAGEEGAREKEKKIEKEKKNKRERKEIMENLEEK